MKLLRNLLSAGFFVALLVCTTPSAWAHADAVSFSPSAGAKLVSLPKQVVITFSEKLLVLADEQTSFIAVTDSGGRRLDAGGSVVSGRTLSVEVPETDNSGTIDVKWRAVAQDGHPLEGTYSFSILTSVSPSPSASNSVIPETTNSPMTTQKSDNKSSSNAQILLLGSLMLVGLAFLILRWRRSNGG